MHSKVLLTKNLEQAEKLVNGSVGFVKEMIYVKRETPASNLPMYVILEFFYTNKPFFGDNSEKYGWVPIKPITTIWFMYDLNEYVEHCCSQIPLNTSWG